MTPDFDAIAASMWDDLPQFPESLDDVKDAWVKRLRELYDEGRRSTSAPPTKSTEDP